ncbi:MAG: hypothetical protein J7578_07380 [Chitinophagaceae bacterium]|nr:hypothetical protein [Chitinophagaceae bacterium]
MKKFFLPVLAAGLILTGCGKDSDPAAPVYQLTKAEYDKDVFEFSYNEQNMLTRIDYKNTDPVEPATPFYVVVNYNNGKPASADMYMKPASGTPYPARNFDFNLDGQNNIAYVAVGYYEENGTIPADARRDTTRFQYNADKKLTGVKYRWSDTYETWTYDAQGNFQTPNSNQMVDGFGYMSTILEQRYDNAVNPFRNISLGQFIFALVGDEFEYKDQLLSNNNPVAYKEDYTETIKYGESSITRKYYYYITRTNTLDENGALKASSMLEKDEKIENGQVVNTENYGPYDRKFTVVKK